MESKNKELQEIFRNNVNKIKCLYIIINESDDLKQAIITNKKYINYHDAFINSQPNQFILTIPN